MQDIQNNPQLLSKILGAILQMSLGFIGGSIVAVIITINFVRSLLGAEVAANTSVLLFIAMILTVALCVHSGQTLMVLARYRRYRNVIASRDQISFQELCKKVNRSLAVVSRDIYEFIRRGLLPGDCLDLEHKELVFNPIIMNMSETATDSPTVLKQHKKRSLLPVYLSVAALLTFALTIRFTNMSDWALAAALTISVFFIFKKVCPPKVWLTEVVRPAEVRPKPVQSGDEALDRFIASADRYSYQLEALQKTMKNEKMRTAVRELQATASDIFDFIKRHPKKVKEVKQFMNYYLPMSIKLLSDYTELEKQSHKGENILKTMTEIEGATDSMRNAFRGELDGLFSDRAVDISADIAVMKSVMQYDYFEEERILQ